MGNISQEIVIADKLRHLIETQTFKAGEKIPSERELCEKMGCSRTLIRQSLGTLVSEGWIIAVEKSGYFVSYPRFSMKLNKFQSITNLFMNLDLTAEKKLITFEEIVADSRISKMLSISLGTEVFCLVRVRYVNDKPVAIERGYITKSLCPSLLTKDVIKNSLYTILANDYSINVDRAHEKITVELATKEEAKLLQIDKNSPVIKKSETVYSDMNDLIEYTENIMIMERFEFVK